MGTSALLAVLTGVGAKLNVSTMTGCVTGKTVTVSNDWAQSVSAPACIFRAESEDNAQLETMGRAGKVVLVNVHLFSDYQGQIEIAAMTSALMSLLHYQTITVAGFTLVATQAREGYDAGAEDIGGGVKRQHWVYPFWVGVKG